MTAGPDPRAHDAFWIVPGYGRDEQTFRRNNRVVQLRAADCRTPDEGLVFDLPGQDDHLEEPEPIRDVYRRAYVVDGVPASSGCVRFTILEVARGAEDDTCISEIVPLRSDVARDVP